MAQQLDIIEMLGGPPLPEPKITKKGKPKRKDPTPSGHYSKPGTGPSDETCASCRHLVRKKLAKTYLKCGKARSIWTGGRKSDVRARNAACKGWEKNDEKEGT